MPQPPSLDDMGRTHLVGIIRGMSMQQQSPVMSNRYWLREYASRYATAGNGPEEATAKAQLLLDAVLTHEQMMLLKDERAEMEAFKKREAEAKAIEEKPKEEPAPESDSHIVLDAAENIPVIESSEPVEEVSQVVGNE